MNRTKFKIEQNYDYIQNAQLDEIINDNYFIDNGLDLNVFILDNVNEVKNFISKYPEIKNILVYLSSIKNKLLKSSTRVFLKIKNNVFYFLVEADYKNINDILDCCNKM